MLFLVGLSVAAPHRTPHPKPDVVAWAPGARHDVLHVKLVDGRGELPRIPGAEVSALFGDAAVLAEEQARTDPDGRLADRTSWLRVEVRGDAVALANALNADPRVEVVFFAPDAVPPPVDLDPVTPDFTDQQSYLRAAPDGLGQAAVQDWPGVGGEHVVIADVEYGWEPEHEELDHTGTTFAWGQGSGDWTFHGNMVLSLLVGRDDGYGVTGFAPEATVAMISPYADVEDYDVAAAISGAASLLGPGDVLLIEQQLQANGAFAPVESSPSTFDAIAAAVAKGIVVVEPSGNGGQNLDDAAWEGWFDRDQRDSGAILVGGGAGVEDTQEPLRGWNGVSCYGDRVDVQGVSSYTVVSATTGDYEPNLFFPEGDDRQAYTTEFGGTSAAAAMVAGVAASFQSAAIELTGVPWDPVELRALMVSTGTPQSEATAQHIGPQPDLEAMLKAAGLR